MPHADPLACSRGPVDRRGKRGIRGRRFARIGSCEYAASRAAIREGEAVGCSPPTSFLTGSTRGVDPCHGPRNGDEAAIEVDVAPSDRAGLADATARTDHERDEVGEVPAHGLVIICE